MTACNSSFSVSEHSYIFTAHIPNKSVEGHITSPVTVTACYGAKETEKKKAFQRITSYHATSFSVNKWKKHVVA